MEPSLISTEIPSDSKLKISLDQIITLQSNNGQKYSIPYQFVRYSKTLENILSDYDEYPGTSIPIDLANTEIDYAIQLLQLCEESHNQKHDDPNPNPIITLHYLDKMNEHFATLAICCRYLDISLPLPTNNYETLFNNFVFEHKKEIGKKNILQNVPIKLLNKKTLTPDLFIAIDENKNYLLVEVVIEAAEIETFYVIDLSKQEILTRLSLECNIPPKKIQTAQTRNKEYVLTIDRETDANFRKKDPLTCTLSYKEKPIAKFSGFRNYDNTFYKFSNKKYGDDATKAKFGDFVERKIESTNNKFAIIKYYHNATTPDFWYFDLESNKKYPFNDDCREGVTQFNLHPDNTLVIMNKNIQLHGYFNNCNYSSLSLYVDRRLLDSTKDIKNNHKHHIEHIFISPKGNYVVSVDEKKYLRIWSLKNYLHMQNLRKKLIEFLPKLTSLHRYLLYKIKTTPMKNFPLPRHFYPLYYSFLETIKVNFGDKQLIEKINELFVHRIDIPEDEKKQLSHLLNS